MRSKQSQRINARTTPPAQAARLMIVRHGTRALQECSNRADDAVKPETHEFWNQVATLIRNGEVR